MLCRLYNLMRLKKTHLSHSQMETYNYTMVTSYIIYKYHTILFRWQRRNRFNWRRRSARSKRCHRVQRQNGRHWCTGSFRGDGQHRVTGFNWGHRTTGALWYIVYGRFILFLRTGELHHINKVNNNNVYLKVIHQKYYSVN